MDRHFQPVDEFSDPFDDGDDEPYSPSDIDSEELVFEFEDSLYEDQEYDESPRSVDLDKDFEDIPLASFAIPLPPGQAPPEAIYSSNAMDDLSLGMELTHLQTSSVILINPDNPVICKDYQKGMCRNENCKNAHEFNFEELQQIVRSRLVPEP